MEKRHICNGNINHVMQQWNVTDHVESQVGDSLQRDMDDDDYNSVLRLDDDVEDAHLLEHDYYKKTTDTLTDPLDNFEETSAEKSNFSIKSKTNLINQGRVNCHMCSVVTKPVQLYSHIEVEHDGEYMWMCKTCLLPFITEERFRYHNSWCKNSWCKSHACIDCNNERLFISRESLIAHIKSKHDGKFPLQCETCSEPLASKFDEECHKPKHDANLLRCSYCGKVCKSVIFREQHMMEHIKTNSTCFICENIFESKDKCYKHLYQHIDIEDGYKCYKCEMTFESYYRMCMHVHLCRRDEVSICEFCGKIFENRKTLQLHIKICHGDESFACEECGATFPVKYKLNNHIHQHHSSVTHVCKVCSKSFKFIECYRRHLLIHKDMFPFSCDYCDKVFRSKWNMTAHTRQHTGEQPYSCSKCGVKFTHNVVRKAHEAKCTDDRRIDAQPKLLPLTGPLNNNRL